MTQLRITNYSVPFYHSCRSCDIFLATVIILCPTLAFSYQIPEGAIPSEIPEGIWRVQGNEAINSLYIFLRVHGYQENYEDYLSQVQLIRDDPKMTSLRSISHDLGYPTKIVKTSMEQIIKPTFPKPAVLFYERVGSEFGTWHLLLYANKEHVGILTGETMIINLIPVDQFRMDWSGYALITESQGSILGLVLRYSSFGIAGVAALSLMLAQARKTRLQLTMSV